MKLTIEKEKWEWDFWISWPFDFDYKEMKEIRSIIMTAIYVLEDSWRREQDKANPACQTENP